MKKIFQEYGGVITVAMAIVALVAVVALLLGGPNGGWVGNAFNDVVGKFSEKATEAIEGDNGIVTKTGEIVLLNDVSSVEHPLSIQLSSDSVSDFSTVTLSKMGKNLLNYQTATDEQAGVSLTNNGDGTCLANGSATAGRSYALGSFEVKAGVEYTVSGLPTTGVTRTSTGLPITGSSDTFWFAITGADVGVDALDYGDGATFVPTASGTVKVRFYWRGDLQFDNCIIRPQAELGGVVTSWESYVAPVTFTPNADGLVEGVTSSSPSMVLTTDTEGVTISCTYQKETN